MNAPMTCDWCGQTQDSLCAMGPHLVQPGDELCCVCAEYVSHAFVGRIGPSKRDRAMWRQERGRRMPGWQTFALAAFFIGHALRLILPRPPRKMDQYRRAYALPRVPRPYRYQMEWSR